jgi:hypothetical protein
VLIILTISVGTETGRKLAGLVSRRHTELMQIYNVHRRELGVQIKGRCTRVPQAGNQP